MEKMWWNQVTNAVRFVTDVTNHILEEKSILLKYTYSVPWREQFESIVVDNVKLQNAEKKFEKISDVDNPGEYLLREFCKKEKRTEYRPSKGYARFFAENDDIVIHDRYIWVQVENEDSLNNWMDFVGDYLKERGKKYNVAVFIIEFVGNNNPSTKKGIKILDFDNYINEFDRVVFNVIASSDLKASPFIKDYISELVSNVVDNDIELAAECILDYRKFSNNPALFLSRVVATQQRSDGTEYQYNKSEEDVNRCIWRAQIKTIYPFLEEYRESFIQKHEGAIGKSLPIESSNGESIDDPKEVELGSLMFMVGSGKLNISTSEYEKLKKYKEARNKLSHLNVLTFSEIEALI